MSDINIQELDKSKIYFITVPNNYEKAEMQDILEKFEAKGIECFIARKDVIVTEYKGFPKITLPKGSSKLVDKAVQEAEKTMGDIDD